MGSAGTGVESGVRWDGLTEVVLSNDRLRVVVLPQLGGRVWEIEHVASGCQLLWHHPAVPPVPVAPGSDYDSNFIGGWDEQFPNDLPERLGRNDYPDHGETWAVSWEWELLRGDAAGVRLRTVGPVSGSTVVRTIRLAPHSTAVDLSVEVTNGSREALPMLHKQHLAVDLPSGSRIDLPRATVEIGAFGRPRAGSPGDRFAWPELPTDSGPVGFAEDPLAPRSELLFASPLEGGWVACTRADGLGIGLAFDTREYPACWTFTSWGGWDGLRVAVLEPSTGTGLSVREGVAGGTHRVLGPGEVFRAHVSAVVYEGLAAVDRISGRGAECVVSGEAR